ncbi:MAG: hypothetical protein MHM6MM_006598 [Cercozoa sp. M6MM]
MQIEDLLPLDLELDQVVENAVLRVSDLHGRLYHWMAAGYPQESDMLLIVQLVSCFVVVFALGVPLLPFLYFLVLFFGSALQLLRKQWFSVLSWLQSCFRRNKTKKTQSESESKDKDARARAAKSQAMQKRSVASRLFCCCRRNKQKAKRPAETESSDEQSICFLVQLEDEIRNVQFRQQANANDVTLDSLHSAIKRKFQCSKECKIRLFDKNNARIVDDEDAQMLCRVAVKSTDIIRLRAVRAAQVDRETKATSPVVTKDSANNDTHTLTATPTKSDAKKRRRRKKRRKKAAAGPADS